MKLIFSVILFLTFQISSAQTPTDYFNTDIKEGQGSSTREIMTALENGKLNYALTFFDPSSTSPLSVASGYDSFNPASDHSNFMLKPRRRRLKK